MMDSHSADDHSITICMVIANIKHYILCQHKLQSLSLSLINFYCMCFLDLIYFLASLQVACITIYCNKEKPKRLGSITNKNRIN